MAEFKFVANITDRHGNPMIGVDVEAIDVNLFTVAAPDPIQYVVAIAKTDISGTAIFTDLPIGLYFARPRINRDDVRIQVMVPSGMAGGGKMCYAALVQPNGLGTHTTIQSAITDLGTGGGVVFICSGTYTEDITVAGDTANLWLIGASRAEVTVVGNWTIQAVGTGAVENFRMEHLTINGDAGVAIYFNSVAGGQPTNVELRDLYIINATVGIDMSDTNGGTNWIIDSVDMASTVTDAGQFEVNYLDIINCRWLVAGKGPYIGGGSAIIDTKITACTFQGGSTYCMRILNATKLVLSSCRFLTTGAGVDGILQGNGATVEISNSTFDLHAGNAINAGAAILAGLTLENLQATCVQPQIVDRIGFDIGSNVSELAIVGCRLKGFESYGIQLGAVQDWVISECVIINGGDTHSIYLNGSDYGAVVGNMLRGKAGAATTYGVGSAGTVEYVVVMGNTVRDHDGVTNLVNNVNGNVVQGNAGSGGSSSPQRFFDKVVAANDSTQQAKDWADYVCDGTADNVEIQAALDSASQVRVLLMAGNYNLAAGITVGANKSLWGAGLEATVITQPNATNLAIMIEVTGADCSIENLDIDGNSANNGPVIGLQVTGVSGTIVRQVQVEDADTGFQETGAAGIWNNFTNCNVQNTVTTPYVLVGTSTRIVNNFLTPDRMLHAKDPNDSFVLRLYQASGTEFLRATGSNKYLEIMNAGYLRIYTDLASTLVFTISGVSNASEQFTVYKASTAVKYFNLNMSGTVGWLELPNGALIRGYSGAYTGLVYMIRGDRGTAEFDPNGNYIGLRVTRNIASAGNPVVSFVQQHTTGGVEVLSLNQAMVAAGVIDFIASDRGVITTSVTDSLASVRVELNGTVYRIPLFVDA